MITFFSSLLAVGGPIEPRDDILENPVLPNIIGRFGGGNSGRILEVFLTNFVTLAFGTGGTITLFMLIWGAYEWMIAGGDKEALQKAQKRMTNALIGLTLLLSSYAIIFLVSVLFGIDLVTINIPVID